MHIDHLSLSSGRTSSIRPMNLQGEAFAILLPWLTAAIATRARMPLPRSTLASLTAIVVVIKGTLIATVYGPTHEISSPGYRALATFGVARTEDDGEHLCEVLLEIGALEPLDNIERPAAPWFTSYRWPGFGRHVRETQELDDFERSIAYLWVSHSGAI